MDVKTSAKVSSLVAAGLILLTACAGDDQSGPSSARPSPSASASAPPQDDVLVIQPGAPGEPTATGGTLVPPAPPAWNDADAEFVQMMVPHHTQALEMSALARTRAQDPQVRAMAERIDAAQLPEIQLMTAWMEEQGVAPMDDMQAMEGMSAMQGMLSSDQMEVLAAARGARFDRLFLRGMIAHHEGAVAMADAVGVGGSAVQVAELAADVGSGQAAEVGRMRDLLRSL